MIFVLFVIKYSKIGHCGRQVTDDHMATESFFSISFGWINQCARVVGNGYVYIDCKDNGARVQHMKMMKPPHHLHSTL